MLNSKAQQFVVGELFCGAGGLSRGFHARGFRPIFANDIWDVALHNFMMNFDALYAQSGGERSDILRVPGSVEDIQVQGLLRHLPAPRHSGHLEAGDLDVLLGGPPCQGFSLNSHIRSADDPRNFLFRHYVRVLRGLAPKLFVLENVPGMLSLDGGRFLEELISDLTHPKSPDAPRYEVEFRILNAAHYGVPQDRFRIVVVGTRHDVASEVGAAALPRPTHYSAAQGHFKGGRTHTFHYAMGRDGTSTRPPGVANLLPDLLPPIPVEDAISDLPSLSNGGGAMVMHYPERKLSTSYQVKVRSGQSTLHNHWARKLMPPNTERVLHIPAGGDWRDIPRDLLPTGMQRALRKDHTTRYGRLDPRAPAGTLLTKPDPHWGTFLHYDVGQQRLISVREAARIQSFPDTHMFYGSQVDQYRLCGNAVPPIMAEAIAEEVRSTLQNYYGCISAAPKVSEMAK